MDIPHIRTILLSLMASGITATVILAPSARANDAPLTSARPFEQVKANIIDETPKTFTIDVYSLANLFVDQEAPVFAVYTTPSAPKECADFRKITIAYDKPDKYKRRFDLSSHKDILNAIETHKCVVIRNSPSGSPQ